MLRPRIIPVLLVAGQAVVKTRQFADPIYIGDPVNAVRIFSDFEVDELIFLDITARSEARIPDLGLLRDVSAEAGMPLAVGGGLNSVEEIERVLSCGIEKVIVGTAAFEHRDLVEKAAHRFGASTISVCLDYRRIAGNLKIFTRGASVDTGLDARTALKMVVEAGAGEIILQSIDQDGIMQGYDLDAIAQLAREVPVPLVALGGAGSGPDFARAVAAGADAVAAGSSFVFFRKRGAVLINRPSAGIGYR